MKASKKLSLIKDIAGMVLGVVIGLSLFFYMFIGAALQESYETTPLTSAEIGE